ncbi:hypothetical protein FCULG_00012650 [Fusarium culmorum]|uniref:NAD(P)-binding domain-containing protein n=1 Tax=Fusarium culmorum TaxID=5516 RepID=A0A2T4GG55_FUSCU|nr:hypothetical protein FCULG_00012650 [Fusarium culmorum]
MIVTIFGANGNLSVRITRLLLQKPNLSVRGYARNISKIPEDIRNHQQYEAIQSEVTDEEKIRGAVRSADVIVCQYQGFDGMNPPLLSPARVTLTNNAPSVVLDGQKRLIDICEEEKVGRFFSSAFVGDIRGMKVGQHERMILTLQIFQYLETKKLRSVHLMCGAFIETWLEYSGVIDLDTNTVSCWGTGDEIWDLTSYDDSIAYTAEAIPDKSADGANGVMLTKDPLDNSRYPHIKPQTVEEFMKTHDLTRPENLQAPNSKSARVEALGK